MNSIVLAMNCFNDIEAAKLCFPIVAPLIDGVILIDGAWEGFPSKEDWSTDGTPEFIMSCMKGKAFTLIRLPKRFSGIESLNVHQEFLDRYWDWSRLWYFRWGCDWQLIPAPGFTMQDVAQEFSDLKTGKYDAFKYANVKFIHKNPGQEGITEGFLGLHDMKGNRRAISHDCIWLGEERVARHRDKYPAFVLPKSMIDHRFIDRPEWRMKAQQEYYTRRVQYILKSEVLSENYPLTPNPNVSGYDIEKVLTEKRKH